MDNQTFLDMTIYVLDASQRVRLGFANGTNVTQFTIPGYLVQGTAHLKFLCDPIGGNRAPSER